MKNKHFVFTIVIISCSAVQLPGTFKKCNRIRSDFKDCLKVAVEDAMGQMFVPFKEVGLSSIEPVVIPDLSVSPGEIVAFDQKYKNFTISGLTEANCNIDTDFASKTMSVNCTFPLVRFEFLYDFNGKFFSTPIYGKGLGTVNFTSMVFTESFRFQEYIKDDLKYYNIKTHKFHFEPADAKIKLDNLFNGDEKKGDSMNYLINEKWRTALKDVQSKYDAFLGETFVNIFNRLLERVPVKELFGEE